MYIYIYSLIYTILFVDGVQLRKGYTEPLEEIIYFLPEISGNR